jgi:hypothetical protein
MCTSGFRLGTGRLTIESLGEVPVDPIGQNLEGLQKRGSLRSAKGLEQMRLELLANSGSQAASLAASPGRSQVKNACVGSAVFSLNEAIAEQHFQKPRCQAAVESRFFGDIAEGDPGIVVNEPERAQFADPETAPRRVDVVCDPHGPGAQHVEAKGEVALRSGLRLSQNLSPCQSILYENVAS